MKEIKGNIWDYYDKGNWIVITTNGTVKKNGGAVMGRGIAKQCVVRFPTTPYIVGKYLKLLGNIPIIVNNRMFTFPVKHNWWEKADIELIERSCQQLVEKTTGLREIYLVRPGCGNGQLDWTDVKPILEKYLDDRFIIVEKSER